VPVLARITPPGTPPPWTVERVLLLTPYAAQTLSDDALRAGWGARLELTLAADASAAALAWVRGRFPRLGDRGVELHVRRDQRLGCGAGAPRSSGAAPQADPSTGGPTRRLKLPTGETGGTPMLEVEEHACPTDLTGKDDGSWQEA